MRRRNRKASIQDVMYIIIIIVAITVGTLLVYKIHNEINLRIQENEDVTTRGKTAMTRLEGMYTGVLDNTFMLLVIGLCIAAIALAAMVRIHPVFIVFFIILLVIIIFLAGVFSNIYQKVASNEKMTDANDSTIYLADKLTYMTYTMRFLPFITGIIGFMMAFIMYKNFQQE